MTRRAPPASIPKVLQSNTATGANRRPHRPGLKHDFSTRLVDFLAIQLLVLDRTIFSETRAPDLSNGVVRVSVYALWKKLSGDQGRVLVALFEFFLHFPGVFNVFFDFRWRICI